MAKKHTKKEIFVDWTLDLLIYIVILNLFAQYSSAIYFETFTISIFTAFVLKALLNLIIGFEHSVANFFSRFKGKFAKYTSYVTAFLILFLSKFLILEVIDIIFGEKVEIYGFVILVAMIITMIATRKIIVHIYNKL